MAKFAVTYEETLTRTYIVEADNQEDAETIIGEAVYYGDIVFDADDFIDYEVSGREATEEDEEYYPKYTPIR